MQVRTATDIGIFIRQRRIELSMDQLTLATKAGTSRKWLVEVERGKPTAEIGLILRTLRALGIKIELTDGTLGIARPHLKDEKSEQAGHIDQILSALRKKS